MVYDDNREGKAVSSVHPSVRPFISTLSFETTYLRTWMFVYWSRTQLA